jgi:NADPH-dependent ferric siderophore reductase
LAGVSILAAIVESGSFARAAEALVGDETALPAIGRRLKESWPEARATVIVEAADAAEDRPLRSAAGLDGILFHRNGVAPGNPRL